MRNKNFINNYHVETNIKIDMDFPERNENVMFSICEKVLKPILGPASIFTFHQSFHCWKLMVMKLKT